MGHYSSDFWSDFARGVCTTEQQQTLQKHLSDGCNECQENYDLWILLRQILQRNVGSEPPAKLLDEVKSAFHAKRKWFQIPSSDTIARLIFNSHLQPSPAGTRSSGLAAHQLVYEAGSLVIDLQVQPEMMPLRVFLTGQVSTTGDAGYLAEAAQVDLMSSDRLIAQTTVGTQGEFDFEIGDETDLSLRIKASGHETVWITLPNQKQD